MLKIKIFLFPWFARSLDGKVCAKIGVNAVK
jgi:hypothetical protein